ncbi:aminopeptidase P family protein [Aerococcus agrisoli]|uniref:Aminopeptidase P family protein n=1 Tax=Aerococcus agrisoli TaxID=2487350 RepID=A0A3N4GE07_9LACT|nr:Xaa-Pro peptidase family protein [Aerococcus agrisoli]RPA60138.1 aminopeptidase P family protein [Aerococcus agrisoli]
MKSLEKRISALQESMAAEGINAYYVTDPFNLRYISGFTGTSGTALITSNHAYFITDFRYREQAKAQCIGYEVIIAGGSAAHTSPLRFVQSVVTEENIVQLGYEEEFMTVAKFDELEDIVSAKLIPASGMIEALRQIKDEEEIAIIQRACEIADAAFDHILGYIKVGMSEIQVANELDFFMRSQGASGVSFETIVASGYRSAMPHGVASEKLIEDGDIVTMDYGCYYKGYVSDITRTIAVGEPSAKMKEIYDIVYQANQLVNEQARAGITGEEMDKIARDFIASQGYGDDFGHSLGHSIGLDIHEGPNASMHNKQILRPNTVITNEPGIYIEGIGGVRIEDDMILTNDGNIVLTHAPRHLIVV